MYIYDDCFPQSSLAESLRGRIAELEYANAKLKLDLQNRYVCCVWSRGFKTATNSALRA